MQSQGAVAPAGALGLKVIRGGGAGVLPVPDVPLRALSVPEIVQRALPRKGMPQHVNDYRARNARHLWRGLRRVVGCRIMSAAHVYGQLYLQVRRGDGRIDDLGIVSLRVVTDAGVAFIVDGFQNLVELENMKYHGFGTGGTAEAAGQTALVTELTTQYATDNTRPTGTTTQGAENVYRTVATLDPDADVAITEHGVFSQAATGGGTMLDRSLFSVINLSGAGGDTLQATYDFTIASAG